MSDDGRSVLECPVSPVCVQHGVSSLIIAPSVPGAAPHLDVIIKFPGPGAKVGLGVHLSVK